MMYGLIIYELQPISRYCLGTCDEAHVRFVDSEPEPKPEAEATTSYQASTLTITGAVEYNSGSKEDNLKVGNAVNTR